MSLSLLKFTGLVLMGFWAGTTTHAWGDHVSQQADFDLASWMNQNGTRKPLSLQTRPDLAVLETQARQSVSEMGEDCSLDHLSEVRIQTENPKLEGIVGYEATLMCEDTPSPVIYFYYTVDLRFLAAITPSL